MNSIKRIWNIAAILTCCTASVLHAGTTFYELMPFHQALLDGDFNEMHNIWNKSTFETRKSYIKNPVFLGGVSLHRSVPPYDGPRRLNHYCMHLAAEGGNVDIAQFLYEQCAQLCPCSTIGERPIHLAAYSNNVAMVAWIVDTGQHHAKGAFDINVITHKDRFHGWWEVTPLFIACKRGYPELVDLLLKNGAKTKVTVGQAGHFAAACEDDECGVEVLKVLNDYKVDLTAGSIDGTPIKIAHAHNNMLIADQLRAWGSTAGEHEPNFMEQLSQASSDSDDQESDDEMGEFFWAPETWNSKELSRRVERNSAGYHDRRVAILRRWRQTGDEGPDSIDWLVEELNKL